jgi:dipeptidase E
MTKALLISSSRAGDTPYLSHALPFIDKTLGEIKEVLFIPYAGVTISFDHYTAKVQNVLDELSIKVVGIHTQADPQQAVKDAQAIVVGGGNTFHLLYQLYRYQLIAPIVSATSQGTPYIGWSAGSNIAGYSIRTTNDMPIIQPPSFDALQLLPFQLNPHYTDYQPPGHNGETRQMRLEEFMVIEPQMPIVGIQEGSALYLEKSLDNDQLSLWGDKEAYLFQGGNKTTVVADADFSFLLTR